MTIFKEETRANFKPHTVEEMERSLENIKSECEDIIDEVSAAQAGNFTAMEDVESFVKASYSYMGTQIERLENAMSQLSDQKGDN